MKLYFEIEEILTEEEMLTRQPLTIRVELSDESKAEGYLKLFRNFFSGRKYVARIHYCYHDEGKPCEMKELERVE